MVVGDGAVGLLGVLSAKQMGAERIIAMSRHEARQKLAREFGATDIVTERGDEGVARIKELTKGVGADSVLECVGTQESMRQAIGATRPGGYVELRRRAARRRSSTAQELFFSHVHLHGGPAPVRRYLPKLIELVSSGSIDPGQGLRPDAAARAGGRGLPRDGRTPRDQDAAPRVKQSLAQAGARESLVIRSVRRRRRARGTGGGCRWWSTGRWGPRRSSARSGSAGAGCWGGWWR